MRRISALIIVLLGACRLNAEQIPSDTDRIIAVGKLWATIRYFHPHIADQEIHWDKCLVDALPAIRAAKDTKEYATAVQAMLDKLHDPSTYVRSHTVGNSAGALRFENSGDILAISMEPTAAASNDLASFLSHLRSARKVVFDLRGASDKLALLLDQPPIQNALSPEPIETAGKRLWVHDGLPSASGINADEYRSAFFVVPGVGIKGDSSADARSYTFILGEDSLLPDIAPALVVAHRATILSESPHYRISQDREHNIFPLGAGLEAVVSLSEPVFPGGSTLFTIPLVLHDRAMQKARASLGNRNFNSAGPALPVVPRIPLEEDYATMPFPSPEYRIVATFKIWEVFRTFYAYREQIDEDWDDTVKEYLPKLLAASNAREYHLAVAEMLTRLNDAQVEARSEEMTNYFGKTSPGLRIRLLEKQLIVTEVLDASAKQAGARIGDIVRSIDNEPTASRLNREAHYVPASTRQWLEYATSRSVLNGPEGSIAELAIVDQAGKENKLQVKRSSEFQTQLEKQRTGEVVRILAGNIGYVDLDRLRSEDVDSMFMQLAGTRGIVFDGRGATHDTARLIASHLTDKSDIPATISTTPFALSADLPGADLPGAGLITQSATRFFVHAIPSTTKPRYSGKTLMLIDERTIAQSERAGLFFEAANKTEFIGTTSAGADGDVTDFVVPGGITIRFPGQDIRHANGGQLERVGLQPSFSVAPTLNAIRAGRDEVLDKAVEYLSAKLQDQ